MIRTQAFGATGHRSSALIFGAFAVNRCDQATADKLLEILLARGVNHIDTAAAYGDSELRIGSWMARHRDDFFLATKTGARSYEGAKRQIDASLTRLSVDCLDLVQLHNLVRPDEWEKAMGAGGALQAVCEARAAGKVRFIGVTGHGLTVARMHMRSLAEFPFDSVLLPWNYVLYRNEAYCQDFMQLWAICRERCVAVQTIKGVTRRPWGTKSPHRNTWYEPFEQQADIDRAVHWLLGQPDLFVNTAGDPDLLPRLLDAGERYVRPPDEQAMTAGLQEGEMANIFHD